MSTSLSSLPPSVQALAFAGQFALAAAKGEYPRPRLTPLYPYCLYTCYGFIGLYQGGIDESIATRSIIKQETA